MELQTTETAESTEEPIVLAEAADLPRTPRLDELARPKELFKEEVRRTGGNIDPESHQMAEVMEMMGDALQNPLLDAREVWEGVEDDVEDACGGDATPVLITMMEHGLEYMTGKVHAVTGSDDEKVTAAAAATSKDLGQKPPLAGKLLKPVEDLKERIRRTGGDMTVSDGNVMEVSSMIANILKDGDTDAEDVWPSVKAEIADVCEEIGIDPEELQYAVLQRTFFTMTEKVQSITAKPKADAVKKDVSARRTAVAGRIHRAAPAALAA